MRRKQLTVSHLTLTQCARFVGVTPSAATQRVQAEHMATIDVFGIPMVPADECRRWLRERLKAQRAKETAHA